MFPGSGPRDGSWGRGRGRGRGGRGFYSSLAPPDEDFSHRPRFGQFYNEPSGPIHAANMPPPGGPPMDPPYMGPMNPMEVTGPQHEINQNVASLKAEMAILLEEQNAMMKQHELSEKQSRVASLKAEMAKLLEEQNEMMKQSGFNDALPQVVKNTESLVSLDKELKRLLKGSQYTPPHEEVDIPEITRYKKSVVEKQRKFTEKSRTSAESRHAKGKLAGQEQLVAEDSVGHWGPPPTAQGYNPRQPHQLGADSHGQASVDSAYSSSHSRSGDRKSQAADDADLKREKGHSKSSGKHRSSSSSDDRTASRDDHPRVNRKSSRDDHNSHPHGDGASSRGNLSRDGDGQMGAGKKSDGAREADKLLSLDIDSLLQDEKLRNVLFAGISKATAKLEQSLQTTDKKVENYASVEDSSSRLKPQQSAQTSSADAPQKLKSILKRKTEERVEIESKVGSDPFNNLSNVGKSFNLLSDKGSKKPVKSIALSHLQSYNDSEDEEHSVKDTNRQTKTKNAPFWSVDAVPAVEEKGKDNKLSDIQEQMYEQWRQSINQSSNVQQAAAKEQGVSKVSQVFQKPEQAHNLASSSQSKKVGAKDEDELDSTVENILQSIGFNFDLSKRMQELARERKKQEGLHTGMINQSASFLGQSEEIVEDVRAALFSDKPEKAQLDSLIKQARESMQKRSTSYERSMKSPDVFSAEVHHGATSFIRGGESSESNDGRNKMSLESHEIRSQQTQKSLKNPDYEELSSEDDDVGGIDSRTIKEKTKRLPYEKLSEVRQQSFSRERDVASPLHSKVMLEEAQRFRNVAQASRDNSLQLSERLRVEKGNEYFYPDDSEPSKTTSLLESLSSKRREISNSGSKSLKLPLQSGLCSTHVENLRVTSRAVHGDDEGDEHFNESRKVILSSKSDVKAVPQLPVLRKSQSPEMKVPRKRPASPSQFPVSKERRVLSEKGSYSELHAFLKRSLEQNAPEICQALGLDADKTSIAKSVFSRLNVSVERAKSPLKSDHLLRDNLRKSPNKQTSRSPDRQTLRSPSHQLSGSSESRKPALPNRRNSRSPEKRKSPIRKKSKSPVKQISRSPERRKSLSLDRQKLRIADRGISKSPERRKSRSPDRWKSGSPDRRSSRSLDRRKSRSPDRRKSRSRSPDRRMSRSPDRRKSRSPDRRKSRTPDRRKSRTPDRRKSRTPDRRKSRSSERRKSRSPSRRLSRSPSRRRSKSPDRRRSRSPDRRRSRSLSKRTSKSPVRRRMGSPDRHRSRSPQRLRSRSPDKRRSVSPAKHRSVSPLRRRSLSLERRRSRSPSRRRSRSVERGKSRSPARLKAKSPLRARTRSPAWRRSKSPLRRLSRSPGRRKSKSPIRRWSRSPGRHRSKSPLRRLSRSPGRHRSKSPLRRLSRSPGRRMFRSQSTRRSRSPRRLPPRPRSPLRLKKLPERQPLPARERCPYPLNVSSAYGRQQPLVSIDSRNDNKITAPAKNSLSNMSAGDRTFIQKELPATQNKELLKDQVEGLLKDQVNKLPREQDKEPKSQQEQPDEDQSKSTLKNDIKLAVEKLAEFPVDERKIILIKMTQMAAAERRSLLDVISEKQIRVALLREEMTKLVQEQNEMMRQSGVNTSIPRMSQNKKALASLIEEVRSLLKASFYIPDLETIDVPERKQFKKPAAKKKKQQATETFKESAESKKVKGKQQVMAAVGVPMSTVGRDTDKIKDVKRATQVPSAAHLPAGQEKVYYEYYDSGSYSCKHCVCNFSSLEQSLRHKHTKIHLSMIETQKKPWKTSEEKQMKPKVGLSRSREIKGEDMIFPVLGFYCSLCREFFGDTEDVTEHLKNDSHYDQYMEFTRNRQYEKSVPLAKTEVHQKNETLNQWTYPEPVEQRIQDSGYKTGSDQQQQPTFSMNNLIVLVGSDSKSDTKVNKLVDTSLENKVPMKEELFKVPNPVARLNPWTPLAAQVLQPEVKIKQLKEEANQPLGQLLTTEKDNSQLEKVPLPDLMIPEDDFLDIPMPEELSPHIPMPEELSPLLDIPMPEESSPLLDIPMPEESSPLLDIPMPEESSPPPEYPDDFEETIELQQVKEKEKKNIDDEKKLKGTDVDAGDKKPKSAVLVTTSPVVSKQIKNATGQTVNSQKVTWPTDQADESPRGKSAAASMADSNKALKRKKDAASIIIIEDSTDDEDVLKGDKPMPAKRAKLATAAAASHGKTKSASQAKQVSTSTAAKVSSPGVGKVSTATAVNVSTPTPTKVSTSAAKVSASASGTQSNAKVTTTKVTTKVTTPAATKVITSAASKVSMPAAAKVSTPTVTKISTSTVAKDSTPVAKKVTTPSTVKLSTPTAVSKNKAKVTTPTTTKVTTPTTTKVTTPTTTKVTTPGAAKITTLAASKVSTPDAAQVSTPTAAITSIVEKGSTPVTKKVTTSSTAKLSTPTDVSKDKAKVSTPTAVNKDKTKVSQPTVAIKDKAKVSTLTASKDKAKASAPTAASKDVAKVSTPVSMDKAKVSTPTAASKDQTKVSTPVSKDKAKVSTPTAASKDKAKVSASTKKKAEVSSTVGNLGEVQCARAGSHEDISGHTETSTASPAVSSIQKPVSADPVAGSQKVAAVVSSVAGSKKVTERKELDTPADSFRKEDMSTAVSDSQEQKVNNTNAGTANKEDTSSDDDDVNEPSHGDNGVKQNRQDIPDENVQIKKKVKNTVSKTSQKQTALEDKGTGDFELTSASIEKYSLEQVDGKIVEKVSSDSHKPESTVSCRDSIQGRKPKTGPGSKLAAMSEVRVVIELLKVIPEFVKTGGKADSQKLSSASEESLSSASSVLGKSAKKIRSATSKKDESSARVRKHGKKKGIAEKDSESEQKRSKSATAPVTLEAGLFGGSGLIRQPILKLQKLLDSELLAHIRPVSQATEKSSLCQPQSPVLKREESCDSDTTITDETEDCPVLSQPAGSGDVVFEAQESTPNDSVQESSEGKESTPNVSVQESSQGKESTPNVNVQESSQGKESTPNVNVLESSQGKESTPNVNVQESSQGKESTPNVSVQESSQGKESTPNVNVQESSQGKESTPNVNVQESSQGKESTPNVSVQESSQGKESTPNVSVQESSQGKESTPNVSVQESSQGKESTPNVNVQESSQGKESTPNVNVLESSQGKESTPNVSVQESSQGKESTPNVSVQESSQGNESTPNVNVQESSQGKESTPNDNAQKSSLGKESTPNDNVQESSEWKHSTSSDSVQESSEEKDPPLLAGDREVAEPKMAADSEKGELSGGASAESG